MYSLYYEFPTILSSLDYFRKIASLAEFANQIFQTVYESFILIPIDYR